MTKKPNATSDRKNSRSNNRDSRPTIEQDGYIRTFRWLMGKTIDDWLNDRAPRLGAALAFYSAFSLAPTLVIIISIAGTVFGQEAVQGQIFSEISKVMGPTAAHAVQGLLASVYRSGSGVTASIVGAVILLITATGVFVELQDSLNTIWQVDVLEESGIKVAIRDRIVSFLILMGIGFLLLALLIASAVFTALARMVETPAYLLHLFDLLFSFGVTTLLFALLFKLVPDVEVAWKDTWIGAAVTAVLFSVGKLLLGLYLGRERLLSTYGGTEAVMFALLWVYYSAQIIIFGAEFTRVYSSYYGSRYKPARGATIRADCPPFTPKHLGHSFSTDRGGPGLDFELHIPNRTGDPIVAAGLRYPDPLVGRRNSMLWTIFVILLILWLVGLVSSYTLGGFIHILLMLAVIVLIIQLVSGRRVI